MSDLLYNESVIPTGGVTPITTSNRTSTLLEIKHRVKVVDGIAANGTATPIYNWGGANDIIEACVVSMYGPNGVQIPVGAVATNTQAIITYTTNSLKKTIVNLAIPNAGAALPANGYVVLLLTIGNRTNLNPPD